MTQFHFLRPWWLLALLPAGLVCWRALRRQDSVRAWAQLISPHLLEALLVGREQRRRLRPVAVLPVLFALSILSLAGPAWRRAPSPDALDAASLFVVLRVTPSMEGTDVQPSRLVRAVLKLRDLLDQREGGPTGLVAYAGTAHLVLPPTRDARIVAQMADELAPSIMPVEGDALARAVERAADGMGDRPGSIVVMADAVSPAQVDALAALENTPPIQFLAVSSRDAPVEPGLAAAARVLGASVVRLTADDADVARLARDAARDVRAAGDETGWEDAGYALLPLLALVALLWARRGWVVE